MARAIPSPVEPQRKLRTIHWKVPTVMVSTFVAGVIVAVCHHIFYSQISGRIVQSGMQQQVVTSAGTAFAFLVKVLLAVSSGTAFIQCLWSTMRARPVKVKNMDSMFAILSNPWEFLNVRFWAVHPILTLTAATTWLIPLSAVFTPGTMSVTLKPHENQRLVQIPQRNYTSGDISIATDDSGQYLYDGGSTFLIDLAGLNLYNGKMLDIRVGSEAQNLTYSLDFYGPALQCTGANDSVTSFVLPAAAQYIKQSQQGLYYSSWVPDEHFNSSINGTFFDDLVENVYRGTAFQLDYISEDATRIFQTLCFFNKTQTFAQNSRQITQHMRVIDCALHNASYEVQFVLKSNGQQVVTTNRTILNGIPAMDTLPATMSAKTAVEWFNAQAIMEMFGFYAAIGTVTYDYNFTGSQHDNSNLATSPYMSRALLPNSYGKVTFDEYTSLLEELFQNISLSWKFGQTPFHISDHIEGDNPGPAAETIATISQYLNTFDYRPRALLIAYGMATLFSLICLVLGLSATYRNGFCYSNSFSSIVRMTRDSAFGYLVDVLDDNGADPVPEELNNARIAYNRGGDYEELRETGRGAGLKVVSHI